MKHYNSSLLGAFTMRTPGHWHPLSPESRLEKYWASLMVLPITSNTVTPAMALATFNTTATVCPAIHPHAHHPLHTPVCAATCFISSLLPTTFKATPTPTHIFCTMDILTQLCPSGLHQCHALPPPAATAQPGSSLSLHLCRKASAPGQQHLLMAVVGGAHILCVEVILLRVPRDRMNLQWYMVDSTESCSASAGAR